MELIFNYIYSDNHACMIAWLIYNKITFLWTLIKKTYVTLTFKNQKSEEKKCIEWIHWIEWSEWIE